MANEETKETKKRALWDRQHGEKSKDYSWFEKFRDMGPFRTIKGMSAKHGIPRHKLHRRCQAHDWWVRAEAWDDHVAKQTAQIVLDAQVMMQQKAIAHLPDLLEQAVGIASGTVEGSHQQVSMLNSMLDRFGLAPTKKVHAEVHHHEERPDLSQLSLEEQKQFLAMLERMTPEAIDVEVVSDEEE